MVEIPQLTPHRRFNASAVFRPLTSRSVPPTVAAIAHAAARGDVEEWRKKIRFAQDDRNALRDALAAGGFALGQHLATNVLSLEPYREHLWRTAFLCGVPQAEAERIVDRSIARAIKGAPPAKPRRAGLKPPWTSATRPHSPGRPKGSKNRKPRRRRRAPPA